MFPEVFRKISPSFERARLPAAPQSSIKSIAALAAFTVVVLTPSYVSPFAAQAQKPAQTGVTADLPPGTMQAKATTACLECHEARIILQQRLSKPAWTKEVDKMMKWGAVVDAADRDALIDYLSMNFSPDKPPYEPQKTAGKSGKTSKQFLKKKQSATDPMSIIPTLRQRCYFYSELDDKSIKNVTALFLVHCRVRRAAHSIRGLLLSLGLPSIVSSSALFRPQQGKQNHIADGM